MKKYFGPIAVMLFVSLTSTYYIGCNKTDHPFGVYAPNGLDVPTYTPTPLSGAIVVNVSDGPNVVSGLAVQAISPGNAVTLLAVTTSGGQVAFNPNPIAAGVWTIQIPRQSNPLSNYGLSQQFVTVGAGFSSATLNFNSGAFIAFLSPVSGSSYPTSLQNNIAYTLSYSQTGFLSVPAIYTFSGMPFPVVGGPATLDASITQASVTFQVPACTFAEPIFSAALYRTGGTAAQLLATSNSAIITRGYPVSIVSLTRAESPVCIVCTVTSGPTTHFDGESMNDIWSISTSGGCAGMPFHIHINFSSTNDSSYSTPNSEDFDLYSGTPYTFNWVPTSTSPVNYAWALTDKNNSSNSWSGNFVFDPHDNYGGSCPCPNSSIFCQPNYTGCASTTTILSNQIVNP